MLLVYNPQKCYVTNRVFPSLGRIWTTSIGWIIASEIIQRVVLRNSKCSTKFLARCFHGTTSQTPRTRERNTVSSQKRIGETTPSYAVSGVVRGSKANIQIWQQSRWTWIVQIRPSTTSPAFRYHYYYQKLISLISKGMYLLKDGPTVKLQCVLTWQISRKASASSLKAERHTQDNLCINQRQVCRCPVHCDPSCSRNRYISRQNGRYSQSVLCITLDPEWKHGSPCRLYHLVVGNYEQHALTCNM